jgi:hypothetical protein
MRGANHAASAMQKIEYCDLQKYVTEEKGIAPTEFLVQIAVETR